MEFSTELRAIIRCHQANDHFDRRGDIRFDERSVDFSAANAWWLAEISRWMYVGKSLSNQERQHPRSILDAAGLVETHYFSEAGTNCALIADKQQRFSVLVFRGTCQLNNWLTNANIGPLVKNAHRGYETALDKVWAPLEAALHATPGSVFFTGHSMGGALATLAARRFRPAGVYTFGAPPVGNATLETEFEQLPVYRLVNFKDVVSRLPFQRGHVGELCYLSRDHSLLRNPSLNDIRLDRSRGTRDASRRLNEGKLLSIPDFLCDHAPQNYLANLERISLGETSEAISDQEPDALMV